VLSYFLFWTAFYVLRGSQAQSLATASRPAIYSHLTPSFGSVKKVITLPPLILGILLVLEARRIASKCAAFPLPSQDGGGTAVSLLTESRCIGIVSRRWA